MKQPRNRASYIGFTLTELLIVKNPLFKPGLMFAVVFFLAAVFSASAASYTWTSTVGGSSITDGAGTWDTSTADWMLNGSGTAGNWVNGSDAAIGNTGAGAAITLGSSVTVGNITFGSGVTSAYTVSSNSPSTYAITLSGTPTITVNASQATISAPLSGAFNVSAGAAGNKLYLTGNETSTGTITINGGILDLKGFAGGAVLPNATAIVINSGGTLWNEFADKPATYNCGYAITVNTGGTFTQKYAGSSAFLGGGTGAPSITLAGGTFDATTAKQPANIAVNVTADSTLGSSANTATITFGTAAWTLMNGTRQLTMNAPMIVNAAIGDGGHGYGLTIAGTSSLTLGATETYTGPTTISAGTLALSFSGALNAASGVSIAAGGTFDVSALATWTAGSTASPAITASGAGTPATIKGGTTVSFASRPVTLNHDGSHDTMLTISAGALTMTGNTITINGSSTLPLGTHNIISVTGGTINLSGSYTVTGTAIPAGAIATVSTSGGTPNNLVLTLQSAPAITGPNNQSFSAGSIVTISATVSGSPPPAVQWQHGSPATNTIDGATGYGSTIAGSTTSTLTITSAQSADAGTYYIIATNAVGKVTNSMSLTFGSSVPTISGLTNQTVLAGNNATLSASVSGSPFPELQWYVSSNGGISSNGIAGATGSSLTLTNVQYSQNNYRYFLVATNSVGTTVSNMTLTVTQIAPTITGLTNQTVDARFNLTLAPTIGGAPAPTFQWSVNGSPISGATNSMLTVTNVQLYQGGYVYTLTANNTAGTTSGNMTMTVTNALFNVQLNGLGAAYTGAGQIGSAGDTWNNPALANFDNSGTAHAAGTTIISGFGLVDNRGATSPVALSLTATNYKSYYGTSSGHGEVSGLNNQSLKFDYNGSTPVPTAAITLAGLPPNTSLNLYGYGSTYNTTIDGSSWTFWSANGGAGATQGCTTGTGMDLTQATNQNSSWIKIVGTTDSGGNLALNVAPQSVSGGVWWQFYLNGFQIQLHTQPLVTALTNQTVVQGNSATLAPTVTGTPSPTFQWYSNSVAIAGATAAALTLNNVQYAQNGCTYSLVSSNQAGMVTNSMTLTVIVTPSISELADTAASPGSTVTLNATVGGVPAPSLQWMRGGTNILDGATGNGSTISGSMSNTLTITAAQVADGSYYSLVASNAAGLVTNTIYLTVASQQAPVITGPLNQTVIQGSNAMFTVSVSANPPAGLQWLDQTGALISGATGNTLTLTNVQYSQNGYTYSLVASNNIGMATNRATLTVLVPAVITQQPSNVTVVVGTAATLTVTATGVPTPSYYQWYRNGSAIGGANTNAYTLSNPQGADNGATFSVVVSNSVNSVTSSAARLTVLSTMTGTFLPTNGAVNISPDQQLRIVFAGGTPLLNTNGAFTVRDAADNSLVQAIDSSQFLSYTPGNTSIQTIPNAAIRTVQGSYSGSGSGSTTYYYMPIALYGNEAWITLTNRLSYGHTYYVNCDPGLFLDSNGASFTGISGTNNWVISTKPAGPATPTTNSGPASITIGQDGAGDFATFQGAFDWIPASNTLARTVHVLPGIYRDSATLAGNRNFVTIVGDGASRTNTQLIYPFIYFAPPNPVFTAGSLRIESSDVAVENLTLDNIIYGVYHPTGYASSGAATNFAGAINTLATTGKRIVFDNVLIKGGQDTIYNISGIIYYTNCEVWGSVDFIYGAALGVFDQCNIVEIRNTGGPITAPNTLYAQPYGMTFLNCTFPRALVANGYPYDVNAGSTTFQRAWGQDGMTTIFNCAVNSQISTAGWGTFGSGGENTCRAREYGTTLLGGGSATTVAQRQAAGTYWLNTIDPDYTNNPALSPTDPSLAPPTGNLNRVAVTVNPSDYTLAAIFGNSFFNLNGWLPAIVPVFTTQPTNRTVNSGATTTFVAAAAGHPDPSFQWLKNGVRISNATNTTFTIANVQPGDAGSYSLVASNTAGSATSSAATLSVTSPTNTIGGVSVPAINLNNVVNVLNYGAVGDGVSTNTTAIQNAINQAGRGGKTNNLYGGTVEIPPGIFLSGPLTLTNNVNLQIDAGAILRMLPFTNYPMTWYTNMLLLVPTNYYFVVSDDFISGNNLTNIEISGSGAIDGQGSPWWPWAYTNGAVRPSMISLSGCNRELIQNVTLSNSPSVFIGIGSGSGNTIVQYVTVRAPSSYDATNPSHNTDACDVRGTNILVQFNDISAGDDDFSCLGSTSGVIVSNNVYGDGHGTSMGSQLAGGSSNFVFINCTYTNTDACAHIKSDRDRGGLIQNINYYNLTFTNVMHPIQIYCQYTNKTIPALDSITPAAAAALGPASVTSTTPMYRDITISNFSGTAQSTRAAGLLWGLPECSISNVTLVNVNLTGSKTFGIYDAKNIQIIDSTHTVPAGVSQYSFFDADVTFSNSTPSTSIVTLDGLTTNGIANSFRFYNSLMTLSNTNAIALNSSVTLGASTFIISNNLTVTPSNSFSFYLGTNAATVIVKGNLTLGGIVNAAAGSGFTNGIYTLITYAGSLNGSLPVLGATPAGYVCSLNTNTAGQVNLVVAAPMGSPGNLVAQGTNLLIKLNWLAAANATGYNLKRSTTNGGAYLFLNNLTATNYADAAVMPGTTYYYVVSATNATGESANSIQASAVPLPSSASTGLNFQISGNQLQLAWPQDHIGWRVEVQTNNMATGLGTNWFTVSGSAATNQFTVPVNTASGSVFYRLVYP